MEDRSGREVLIVPGTGRFISDHAASVPAYVGTGEGEVTLDFDGIDIKEVVKTILGDLLNKNYAIDQKVAGNVTLNTSRPLNAESLLPVLETLLEMNGAVLLREGDLYKIVPKATAAAGRAAPRIGVTPGKGFQTIVVPLRFIAAEDMKKLLGSLQPGKNEIQADARRNLLIASGTERNLTQLLDAVAVFDVDQFAGMSVGLFRLNFLDAKQMIAELNELAVGQESGPLFRMVRFMPMERINSILVISSQPTYLTYMKEWIERLDRADLIAGLGLYVYRVKNRDAARLAEVLQSLYPGTGAGVPAGEVGLAPGLTPTVKTAAGQPFSQPPPLPAVGGPGLKAKLDQPIQEGRTAAIEAAITPAGGEGVSAEVGEVRIIADEDNNALIIMASAEDYAKIEATLQRLDALPLQVLIEATIIEVQLTDELKYGVEWFFRNTSSTEGLRQEGRLNFGDAVLQNSVGFSYSFLTGDDDLRFIVNLLATEASLDVLSSPSLMVVDNRTAEIRVGNQVPVRTQSAVTEGGTQIESVQFKDTGVLLTVKPRVNAGGLVTMEVSQEVNTAGDIDPATGQREFLQRTINSTVAVHTGQTVVLGGLITENRAKSEQGVPVLYKVPVIGKLFGTTNKATDRAELLVLLTPRVVESQENAQQILQELRARMQGIAWEAYERTQASPGGAAQNAE